MNPKTVPPSTSRALILKALLIIAVGLWVFSPAFHGDWLWDDGLLIRQNELVHDPSGLWKIWFEPHRLVDYLPITVSVEWIEWHLWHANTLGYHLTNVGLHILSALLVWRLLGKLNLRLAWLGGLLFVLHPATVESVAWIAEIKNTLSLPFFLLAMCSWIDFDRAGKRTDYFWALGLFLIAMLCKATMVMFPVLILLYAWWKRNRIAWNDLKLSAPFFTVSLVLGIITLTFLHPAMGVKSVPLGDPLSRLGLSGKILAFYFSKCVLPIDLLPIYPKWPINSPSPSQFLPWLILFVVIAWCWQSKVTWGRHVLFGLGFFLVNLAPFLGFTQGAYMSFTWVMDHILYIPLIGLIGLAVAGCEWLGEKLPKPLGILGVGVVASIVALLAAESHSYAAVFINQETLWTYTLQGNPDSAVAHSNLGLVYLNSNRLPQAIEQFDAAINLKPDYTYALNGLGNALYLSGHAEEAIERYRAALKIDSQYPEAHNGLGNALLQSGRIDEAKTEIEASLKISPHYVEALCTMGLILAQEGDLSGAITHFETAQKLNPDDPRITQELESLRSQEK